MCFDLSINGDEIREGDEMFTVTITVGNSNDVIVGSNTVTVTILDDNDGMNTVVVANDQQLNDTSYIVEVYMYVCCTIPCYY